MECHKFFFRGSTVDGSELRRAYQVECIQKKTLLNGIYQIKCQAQLVAC